MKIDINTVSLYKKELRRADAHDGPNGNDNVIDAKEAESALRNILTNLEIADAPKMYQRVLRRDVDSKESPTANDGKINPSEVDAALKALLKIAPLHTVLQDFVYGPQPTCSQEATPVKKIPEISKVKVKTTQGRYSRDIQALYNYFMGNSGDPPNASKIYKVDGKEAIMIYHVYEDRPTHLRNGGATTSEAGLVLNFAALYAGITNNTRLLDGVYNYMRYFMMPHDGLESRQLPDSRLCAPMFYPSRDAHWLVDLSGHARTGDAIFGENIGYKVYDPGFDPHPAIAQDNEFGLPDLRGVWRYPDGREDRNTYKFASALDAEQWIVDGYYFATKYTDRDFSEDIAMARPSLLDALMPGGENQNVMRFGKYWGGNLNEGWKWVDYGNDLYTGYQDPASWVIMGEPDVAAAQVNFLFKAQKEFTKKNGVEGPFVPVCDQGSVWGWEGTDTKSEYVWKGADENTDWTGFQFRTFAHLAHYYYLTGDKKAKEILVKFILWVEGNKEINGTKIDLPFELDKETGEITKVRYSPHNHGLYAQGLIYLAARDNNKKYEDGATSLLDDLVKNRKNKFGAFTEPPNPPKEDKALIYGFHQCEVGIAFSLYQILLGK